MRVVCALRILVGISTLAALPLVAPALGAQESATPNRPALVIGGPSTLGLEFPITERWTLRPDLSLTRTTFSVSGNETKFANLGVGLGLLIGLGEHEGVRTYAMPRVAISRTTFDDGGISDLWFFDAAFGASAPVTKRLALFGEIGPRVTYSDNSTASGTNRTTNLVARSSIGINYTF
jgi:hypothetical protein